jgi:hypothetical protein
MLNKMLRFSYHGEMKKKWNKICCPINILELVWLRRGERRKNLQPLLHGSRVLKSKSPKYIVFVLQFKS